MRNKYWYQLILAILLFTVTIDKSFSQDFPEKPVPPRLVNDFAGMFSTQEADILERKLVAFNDST